MRAGWAIRNDRALEHAGNKLCSCGHTMREHRELPSESYGFDAATGTMTVTPNPAYEPLVFHCDRDGCDCHFKLAAR